MPAVLRRKCSEQVSYSLAVSPAETEELLAELPDKIRKDLLESVMHEIAALRYDTPSRCAYYAAREQSHLIVWLWCNLGFACSRPPSRGGR